MSNNISKKNSKKIIASSITSRIGNQVFDYCNQNLLVSLFPKATILISIYQSTEQIIGIIFNLIAGVFADIHDRKKLLILTDFLSGITCLISVFLLHSSIVYLVVIIGNILLGVLFAFNSPVYNAIVKDSIEEGYIERHLSRYSVCKEIISIVAPTIGIFIWQVWGIYVAYIFNAITFFVSSYISYNIVIISKNEERADKANVLKKILEGFAYIKSNKEVYLLLVVSSLTNLFLSGYNIQLPFLNRYYANVTNNYYGKVLIVSAIGSILFPILYRIIFKNKEADSRKVVSISMFLEGVSLILIFVLDKISNAYITLIPFLLFSGFLTIYNIHFFTIVQKKVASKYIGRVYSVIFTVAVLFMPIGNFLFAFLINTGNLFVFIVSGLGILLALIFYRFRLQSEK